MINQEFKDMIQAPSVIRALAGYANKRGQEIGYENVFDYSLGNPSVPVPEELTKTMIELLQNETSSFLHGYSPNPGNPMAREETAKHLNKVFGMDYKMDHIFMTSGAAGAVAHALRCVTKPGDEVLTFAPYFPEYNPYVNKTGAVLKVVPADTSSFQINFDAFEEMLNPKVMAVLINTPNNPSGIVYSTDTIKKLAEILNEKEKEYGHPIFIISDEPYRELVYGGITVPYIPKYYKNTLVCYSWSKSLSLPGERIGYIVVPDEVADFERVYGGIAGAARVLTHVNASSLFQRVVARCVDEPSNIAAYERNGNLLYNGLVEAGFTCQKPQGAFYLFPKALEDDDYAFCERAKKYDLLLVPGSDFGCPGYFRAAYCIKQETIEKSIPAFKKLAAEYGR